MLFYFDTSAFNSLFDSANLSLISSIISKQHVVYPSVFNIAEIVSTTDKARRNGLLKLTKQLSKNFHPLAFPADLLKRAIICVKKRTKEMGHSMGPEWDAFWIALTDPSQIDQDTYEEITEWKKEQEELFQSIHDNGRDKMQSFINSLPDNERLSIISNFSKFIKCYSPEGVLVKDIVLDFATRASVNVEDTKMFVQDIIRHSEHLKYFLASMGYGLFARAVKQNNFSKKKNPGGIDTHQAVFLAACDAFVTADKEQRKMLRFIVPFGNKKRTILSYNEFESIMMKN